MKVTPLAQGTGVPAQSDSSTGRTASPDRIANAKAIAAGQDPVKVDKGSGDVLVDRVQSSMKRIKMKTQQSTNRHDNVISEPDPSLPEQQVTTPDANEPVKEAEATKPLDPQVAAIIKAKRANQVKELELAKREEALKSQTPAENVDFKAKLKADPLSVLQEAGVTYDQLTEAILANQSAPVDPIKLRNEIKEELKKELFGELDARDQRSEQQVLSEIRREATNLVSSKPEQYEAIIEAKAQNHVVELIHRTWKATGEVMDVTEAAELVENQLIDEALPFARIKKVQTRLTPKQEAVVEQIVQAKPNTKIMRTLTNRDSVSPVMDKRARAIAAMQGTLKR